jgi:hypothetical protein
MDRGPQSFHRGPIFPDVAVKTEKDADAFATTFGGCAKVNMTISHAFLALDLVKAAIEGRLPYGMGVTRLCELPPEWSRQYRVLGLTSP